MSSQMVCACALALLGFAVSPVMAQTADTVMNHSGEPVPGHAVAVADTEPAVIQYDLSGPRIGLTLSSEGAARSQFGWHSENQAAPGTRGPWFLVERIFLIGGVERSEFIPTGTLVFGVRTPSSFEFGIGPSQTTSSDCPVHSSCSAALAARTARRSSRAIASRQAFVATR